MGSRKQTRLPDDLAFECKTCEFTTQKEKEFREHVLLHYSPLPLECKMKCHLCDVEEDSASLFWNHLEKKRHQAYVFYTENIAYFQEKNRKSAMNLTSQKFGEKTARKVEIDRFLKESQKSILKTQKNG
ncbi:hypothetical protein C8_413 [Cannes 8 virus]|uniref:C2H2-type domain-containing protein n=1 Tax=Marseillevirus marseillevirus TaxID=694581 RepID=D2XA77_GBMV|nr:hypothetical protein MAR_ORF069 [Marseillevirus marseillevirus]ADB03854.1 hypothetical protein MAR_ORF069 [Marseillevirus marseillevirus]AGV01762.1 hypothetical protein C8_413 [Cannes 8 virus]AVR53111.1 hypothetical protein MarSH_406 [Marseillevirus Shanghai 1]